jgi:hypothetical protein
MSALALSQLLSSAQDKGVELNLETAEVENQVTDIRLPSILPQQIFGSAAKRLISICI